MEIFRKELNDDKLDVKVEKLKDDKVASNGCFVRRKPPYGRDDEDVRYEPGTDGTEGQTLVLNANNALVQYVLNNPEGEHVNMFCQQIYDLALLSHCPLSAEAMTKFVARSNEILKLLAK